MYPKLKHAKIIPIYKKGDETDPTNYRPISLLSVFNRIFEKIMYNGLKYFLEKQNVLYQSQYGFREKHSTQHAILDIVNQIHTNMNNRMYSCGIFIDWQKAFDTVDHLILLRKLEHYGVRGISGVASPKIWSCYANISVFIDREKQSISKEMNNYNDVIFA